MFGKPKGQHGWQASTAGRPAQLAGQHSWSASTAGMFKSVVLGFVNNAFKPLFIRLH